MEIKDLTTEQLIKRLRTDAKELRMESCMYIIADLMDEAAKRIENNIKKEKNYEQ